MTRTFGLLGLGLLCLTAVAVAGCSSGGSTPGRSADGGEELDGGGECRAPHQMCGSECVNPQSDPSHCGRCGNVCAPGAFCERGTCAESSACLDGEEECGDECVNLSTDSNHCGSCDSPCSELRACEGGDCVCTDGLVECDGSCVDVERSREHCGMCDRDCDEGVDCIEGSCGGDAEECDPACGPDARCVDGDCVPITDDECTVDGECAYTNATGACDMGECVLESCDSEYRDCDEDDSNGCETRLGTVFNCGYCGDRCMLSRARPTCDGGSCVVASCHRGYADCDGDDSNGCERDFSHRNTCETALDIGDACGDNNCGGFCPGTEWIAFSDHSDHKSRWFRAQANECSRCSASVRHRIRLEVPSGLDYDLYAYSACDEGWASSTGGSFGEDEEIELSRPDRSGPDDAFEYFVEVRYRAGEACGEWTLYFDGRAREGRDPTEGC